MFRAVAHASLTGRVEASTEVPGSIRNKETIKSRQGRLTLVSAPAECKITGRLKYVDATPQLKYLRRPPSTDVEA